ncbi:hypothetical protein ACS0TY_005117 [Phlomoides rotata]
MALGKIAIPIVSILLVVGVVIGVVVVMKKNDVHQAPTANVTGSMKSVTSICELTNYKEACAASLEFTAKNASATPKDYIFAVVEATFKELNKSREATGKVVVDKEKDESSHMAVEDCKELLDYAADVLQASMSMVGDSDMHTLEDRAHELLSWVTSVYAFQTDCSDNIQSPEYKSAIENGMVNATQLTHNAVNIVAELSQVLKMFNVPTSLTASQRRLMSAEDGFPSWISGADRRLLAAAGGAAPNAVVAKDGSGKFKTIKDALASYPAKHEGRFVIYVKAGVYDEQVIVDKKKPNVYIYGDGIGKTIIYDAANEGENFVARAMTFRNEAGPEGHQAVAFRSIGDKTALFDCSFEASQDTLYYQNQRQFYRNCRIYGTVDFIFGKGSCLIQDSEIIVRRPLPNQFNTVTADGKEIETGSNGLVMHNCRIVPDSFLFDARFQIPTYLGRPWKAYALTVTMQTELADFIRPEGYKIWDGESYHKTCSMFEYANRGPGANTNQRSKDFAKFKVISAAEAAKFAAGPFLTGDQWLPQTSVPFRLGL